MINNNNKIAPDDFVKKYSSSLDQLEETTNNKTFAVDEPDNSDHDLTIVSNKKKHENSDDEPHISTSNPVPSNRSSICKRKADQLVESQSIDKENTPS